MISKERLQELIEKGGTIYYIETNWVNKNIRYIGSLVLDKKKHIIGYDTYDFSLPEQENRVLREEIGQYDEGIAKLQDIYEDLEETKFDVEFKRVAKTTYLDLPTWEEFIKDEKFIEGNEVGFYDDVGIRYKLLKTQYTTPKMICLFEEGIQGDYICEKYELTKENYILACKKCKELFLGESYE